MVGWKALQLEEDKQVGRGFRAVRTPVQSIPTSTTTTIVCQSEDFDTQNEYNTADGKYTPQTAGYYVISGNVVFETLPDGTKFVIRIKKNTVIAGVDRGILGGENWAGGCVTVVLYMNGSTDYTLLECIQDSGSNKNTGNLQTSFQGWILPAP